MIDPNETFDGTFPFAPRFTRAGGFRMHYVDEGSGDPIVCLHGEPTWGYLYRKFIPPLSRTHRVVVPDAMGFGKSETPRDRSYTLKTHVENLTALVEELDLRDITFVAQDWGGPIATHFAIRHPDRVKRFFMMNTVTGYGPRDGALASPWFEWIGAGLENGRTRAVLSNLGTTVMSVMRLLGLERSEVVDRTWERAYSAPFDTAEECVGAIEFPLDVYLGRVKTYYKEGLPGLARVRQMSAMLANGMKDRAIPPEVAIADFKTVWPDAPVVELPNAGHFCQEDCPETLVALLRLFLQT